MKSPSILLTRVWTPLVLKYLRIEAPNRDLSRWEDIVRRSYNPKDTVTIGIVGKYVEYEDPISR